MYKWLEAVLKEQYQFIRCLRRTARSEVILLEHKKPAPPDHQTYFYRECGGIPETAPAETEKYA